MKPEEDGYLIEVKRELLGVEASLLPMDYLYEDAKKNQNDAKAEVYKGERAKLIAARDRLQQHVNEVEAELDEYNKLHDHHRHSIQDGLKGLKEKLASLISHHGS
jgi:uncharacterized protein YlxW (UPF0749 family)